MIYIMIEIDGTLIIKSGHRLGINHDGKGVDWVDYDGEDRIDHEGEIDNDGIDHES